MKILSWSLPFFLLLAALPAYAKSVAEQQDAHVIEGLRDAGSDMSKPHDIDFFFYFPSRQKAEAAIADLKSLGYIIVEAGVTPGQSDWHVHASRRMVPDLEAMNASTRTLEALGAKHDGEYDGWGTSVVE